MVVTPDHGTSRIHARTALVAAVLLALVGTPAAVWAQASDPVIARVEGQDIRESDLALAEDDLGENAAKMTPDAKRDYLIAYVADVLTVAKAAEQKKVADSAEFKQRFAFLRAKLLMETLLQTEGKAALTDEAMKAVYADAVKQMGDEEEVRARHILVPTEAEAKAVLAELKKGGNFETLAKEKSKDPGAAAQGGDLGYFTKDQMVPEFAEVAFKLNPGQLSDPVKSSFGFHIIKVEDKRKKPAPPFEQVKEQVETYVTRRAQADLVTKLRESVKIERLDQPAAGAVPAAPGAPTPK